MANRHPLLGEVWNATVATSSFRIKQNCPAHLLSQYILGEPASDDWILLHRARRSAGIRGDTFLP